MLDWMPHADRVRGAQAGNAMLGGPSKVTHHITTGGGYDFLQGYLMQRGYEPTLLVDPYQGRIAQFLSAGRGGYALKHVTAPTNTQGTRHIQIEWMWVDMGDRTLDRAPKFQEVWQRVLAFCRENGISDQVPFGDLTVARNDRSVSKWKQGGHACHFNAPGNDHSDGLPVSNQRALFAPVVTPKPTPTPTPTPTTEERMLVKFSGPAVWEVVGSKLVHVSAEAWAARGLKAAQVHNLSDSHPLNSLAKEE